MATKIKDGKHEYWLDGEGLKVPLKHVPLNDQRRDALVEELVAEATRLNMMIVSAKQMMLAKIAAYLEEVAGEYGEGWQGNARIRNFSQNKEVEISQAKLLTFDERLNVAKTKIDKCITSWAKGSKTEIIALVNQAFRVNQKGQVDVKELLKLPTLQIDDAEWQEAMAIIKDSVTVQSTKQYLNFRTRGNDERWNTIPLNFSIV
ncbi:MAG TPA: DUF3164 family protein [Candidatus Syntrophosphaera sp.]|nr:DUF3164 family protein [Candidatus Syntrophosphaera sp.]HPH61191.1 DUF3164 family protein [Candidatus Syntrophosphaera sp.]